MYRDARYPVMRVDMCRWLILHSYGGLYADLDTTPNRWWYEQTALALPRIKNPKKSKRSARAMRGAAKSDHVVDDDNCYLDMEVIIGARENDMLVEIVEYMKQEIASHPYTKGSFWYLAKMRYIYHTTGPHCLQRFIRTNKDRLTANHLQYLQCNHFKAANRLTVAQMRRFDVISYESNSYFTKKHKIVVPVGPGDKPLPTMPGSKRLYGKLAANSGSLHDHNLEEGDVASPVVQAVPTKLHHGRRQMGTCAQMNSKGRTSRTSKRTLHARMLTAARDTNDDLNKRIKVHQGREQAVQTFFHYMNKETLDAVMDEMPAQMTEWAINGPSFSELQDKRRV